MLLVLRYTYSDYPFGIFKLFLWSLSRTFVLTRVTRRVLPVGWNCPFFQSTRVHPHDFCGVHVAQSLVFCVMYCGWSFMFLSLVFWPLYCVFFIDLKLLITPLSSIFKFFLNITISWSRNWWNVKYLELFFSLLLLLVLAICVVFWFCYLIFYLSYFVHSNLDFYTVP